MKTLEVAKVIFVIIVFFLFCWLVIISSMIYDKNSEIYLENCNKVCSGYNMSFSSVSVDEIDSCLCKGKYGELIEYRVDSK
jgi:hypothetical protein